MKFNSSFWIAIGAVAPAVIIAIIVSAVEVMGSLIAVGGVVQRISFVKIFRQGAPTRSEGEYEQRVRTDYVALRIAYLSHSANMLAQGFVLVVSLESLAYSDNFLPLQIMIWIEAASILLLFLGAISAPYFRPIVKSLIEGGSDKFQNLAAFELSCLNVTKALAGLPLPLPIRPARCSRMCRIRVGILLDIGRGAGQSKFAGAGV